MLSFAFYVYMMIHSQEDRENSARIVPPGWVGNAWGPKANKERSEGKIPPIVRTPNMQKWDDWGSRYLKTGDIVFRRGDARILLGWFPFSKFLANISGSKFSHVGTILMVDNQPLVYDTSKDGPQKQPLSVWMLDNVGDFGAKRLKPEHQSKIPVIMKWLEDTYQKQVPFDFKLLDDDRELYCVEMAEKAFRHAGIKLADSVKLGNMERLQEFPVCVLGFLTFTSLTLEQEVFFPGNERHGIWGSSALETLYTTVK